MIDNDAHLNSSVGYVITPSTETSRQISFIARDTQSFCVVSPPPPKKKTKWLKGATFYGFSMVFFLLHGTCEGKGETVRHRTIKNFSSALEQHYELKMTLTTELKSNMIRIPFPGLGEEEEEIRREPRSNPGKNSLEREREGEMKITHTSRSRLHRVCRSTAPMTCPVTVTWVVGRRGRHRRRAATRVGQGRQHDAQREDARRAHGARHGHGRTAAVVAHRRRRRRGGSCFGGGEGRAGRAAWRGVVLLLFPRRAGVRWQRRAWEPRGQKIITLGLGFGFGCHCNGSSVCVLSARGGGGDWRCSGRGRG